MKTKGVTPARLIAAASVVGLYLAVTHIPAPSSAGKVETTITTCEIVVDDFGDPSIRIVGTATNLGTVERSYTIRAAGFDGTFWIGAVDATAFSVRPGESREWGGRGPADRLHPLPAVPSCRVLNTAEE